MKSLLDKLLPFGKGSREKKLLEEEQIRRQITALYGLLSGIYGSDKLVLKASKLESLDLMRSSEIEDRLLALERIIYEDPTIREIPKRKEIPALLEKMENEIADVLARRSVEDSIERKINDKLQKRHEEYVREMKMQIIKEDGGPENSQTLKQYAELEVLESIHLSRTALEALRPASLDEVIGQDKAVKAILSKLASPYPQHIILYGPPGVGKTTVARLALEKAKQLNYTPFRDKASFIEVDATTLRWDPRDVTNPLLGSVHDPIYQGARRDFADSGVPEPKLGLVTEAHGGVLFIDEIGELDLLLQNKLLKVLEDKRVFFDSSYYDPANNQIPKYIKKIFEEGAPADFILIGATTRESYEINPALRSRCTEVYFQPLTQLDIEKIVLNAADKLGVKLDEAVPRIISEYTIEGRKAINILADAYGLALYQKQDSEAEAVITEQLVYEVLQTARLTPYSLSKAKKEGLVGKIFGLGVSGYLGSVIEIEAVAFPVSEKGKPGTVRFNETAGSMAKDSVFNAASLIRGLTGEDTSGYDLHVNVIGGGRIDGPSAGCAITLALYSALQKKPLRQDVAVTGEVSLQGQIKPVGGVFEKIYGAKQAGIKKVIIPEENQRDVPADLTGIEVVAVKNLEEALEHVLLRS